MKLFGYWRSSSTWRVRIALAHKSIPYTSDAVHLTRDGGEQHHDVHTARNPMAQVPVLEVTDYGKLLHISQSLAIIEYLEERFPTPALLPPGRAARAQVRLCAELVNSGIQPLQNLSVLRRLKNDLGLDEQAWARHFIAHGFEALEEELHDSAGRYCVGDAVSIADCCLVPQVYNARRFGVEVSHYPTILRVEAACNELDAFKTSHPDRQSDAVPAQ